MAVPTGPPGTGSDPSGGSHHGYIVGAESTGVGAGCEQCRRAVAESVPALELTRHQDVDRASLALSSAWPVLTDYRPARPAAGRRKALSSGLLLKGWPTSAVIAAEDVLAAPDLPEELASDIEMARLWALAALGDFTGIRERVEAIVAAGDRRGDDAVAGAKIILSLIAWDEGRLTDGLDLVRDAVRQATPGSAATRYHDPLPARRWLAARLAEVGDSDGADAAIRAAAAEIDLLGDAVQAAACAVLRSRIDLDAGRLDAAAAGAQSGLAAAEKLGASLLTPAALCVLATVALRRGDLARAAQHVQRYRTQLEADPATFGSARYACVEAQLADAEDGPGRAFEVLAPIYERLPTHPGLLVEDPGAAAWMVRTALAVGDHQRATTVVAAAAQLAASNPAFPTVSAIADHARALLDRDPARLVRSAATHRHPWTRASAAEDAGVLLTDHGDRQGAIAHFDKAMATYQQIGADRDAARVRSRLRRLGARQRHWRVAARPVYGWDSLTETERTVADLVAQGLTNRQIAARMFLSPHTVDFHLRQIFRKLDIRSRVDLTRVVLEHHDSDDRDGERAPNPTNARAAASPSQGIEPVGVRVLSHR